MRDETSGVPAQRLLITLERLLSIETLELRHALDQASQWVVKALDADKVDVFLHDPTIDSLVAVGTSNTPMGRLQHRLGLSQVPLANGGFEVIAYQTGATFYTAHADQDPTVTVGVWRHLGARSIIVVPLSIGAEERGLLQVCSAQPDHFSAEDLRFAEAVARWVGIVAHRAALTERVAREAAEQGRRLAADDLISILAHDLRTPLTPARGFLDLLTRRLTKDGRTDDLRYVAQANEALRRLQQMIGNLLDASRLDQDIFALTLQPVDVVHMVQQTAEMLQTPGTPIEVVAPHDLVLEQGDSDRLRQALENLISNAVTHSPAEVPVVIQVDQQVRDDGEWVVIEIRDQGPGIAPALLPTLFERFARGANSTGLGLGLYLARGIAEAHGGTLTVQSQQGSGTSFMLALPLCRQAQSPRTGTSRWRPTS